MNNTDLQIAWSIERNAGSLVNSVSKSYYEKALWDITVIRAQLISLEGIIKENMSNE